MPTTATNILCFMFVSSLFHAAEPPVAALVGDDGLVQGPAVEVRPQGIAEVKLRIGALPQQKAGQALLAAGADDELRVRDPRRVQIAGEQGIIQLLRPLLPGGAVGGKTPGCSQNLVAPAVIQAHVGLEVIPGQVLRDLVRLPGQGPQIRGDRGHVPEEVEPDVVLLHGVHCLQQIPLQQGHDGRDLHL